MTWAMGNEQRADVRLDCAPRIDEQPGLAEWEELAQWRARWQCAPINGMNELCLLFLKVMRRGYASYFGGATVMPEVFARDESLTRMWRAGYARAQLDNAGGDVSPPAFP